MPASNIVFARSGASVMTSQDTFDTIGNRLSTLAGGDSNGTNRRAASYRNNALNQITNRDVPGYVYILGEALATNTVNVSGSNAYRIWEYFREQLPVKK